MVIKSGANRAHDHYHGTRTNYLVEIVIKLIYGYVFTF